MPFIERPILNPDRERLTLTGWLSCFVMIVGLIPAFIGVVADREILAYVGMLIIIVGIIIGRLR